MQMNKNIIERKAVDTAGRLGTAYDASCDKVVAINDMKRHQVTVSNKHSTCEIFPGHKSTDIIDYLKKMNFDDAIRQSLLLEMIQPSGVSSVISYDGPINENTRFLYYLYRHKTEKLNLTNENATKILSRSQYFAPSTHVITEIQWGIEILCVIQIPNEKPVEIVDNLLHSISQRLNNNKHKFILKDGERMQIKQLKNVNIYISKDYMKTSNQPLEAVLTELPGWLEREFIFHQPLVYTMHALKWLFKDNVFTEMNDFTDSMNDFIERIQFMSRYINITIRESDALLKKCSEKLLILKLNERLKGFQSEFSALSKTQGRFLKDCQTTVITLRRNALKLERTNGNKLEQSYDSLKTELDVFFKCLEQQWNKVLLLEKLSEDLIDYKDLSEILPRTPKSKTFEEIHAALRSHFVENKTSVILFYSSNQLKQGNEDKWKEKYRQFLLKKQNSTEATTLIYVDFIQYEQILQDLIIMVIPARTVPTPTNQSSSRT